MTKTILRKDAELFDDLVKAIKPKIIICLGKITYEVVTNQKANGFVDRLSKGEPFYTTYPGEEKIKVYGVAHCGSFGTNNVGGMENMKKAWKAIAKDFHKLNE